MVDGPSVHDIFSRRKLMRILHILDHSIPLHSGYTFRTLAILKEQRVLGWETIHLTGSKQENCQVLEEDVDGWHFYRTPVAQDAMSRLPVFNQTAVIDRLARFARGPQTGHSGCLRSPGILGRRSGRSRHQSRVGNPVSNYPWAGELRAAAS